MKAMIKITLAFTVFIAASGLAQAKQGYAIAALVYEKTSKQIWKVENQSLLASLDDGKSWADLSAPLVWQGSPNVAVSSDGNTIYASTDRGIYRRLGESNHWEPITLPSSSVTALAAHSTQPNTIYVSIAGDGIYRSQDAGKTWRKMDRGPDKVRQMLHSSLKGSMDSGWLYVLPDAGLRLSMDCFCLWRNIGDPKTKYEAVTIDPDQPELIYAATKDSILRSTNGGQDWEWVANPGLVITALAAGHSKKIYLGTADGKLYRSSNAGVSWEFMSD